MLMLLFQAAPQTIYVQQASGGMPEWGRLLVSAIIGAAFGVGSSILMETIKPQIANARLKRLIVKQLLFELRRNLLFAEPCLKYLADVLLGDPIPLDMVYETLEITFRALGWKRYEFYLEQERGSFYEIDPDDVFARLKNLTDRAEIHAKAGDFRKTQISMQDFKYQCQQVIERLEKNSTGPIEYVDRKQVVPV